MTYEVADVGVVHVAVDDCRGQLCASSKGKFSENLHGSPELVTIDEVVERRRRIPRPASLSSRRLECPLSE